MTSQFCRCFFFIVLKKTDMKNKPINMGGLTVMALHPHIYPATVYLTNKVQRR